MRAIASLRARARRDGIPDPTLRHWLRAYGTRTARLLDLIGQRPALRAPLAAGHPHAAVEIVMAAADEMAATVEDVLLRRTRLGYVLPDQGREIAPAVASLMEAALGWPAGAAAAQVEAYRRTAATMAPPNQEPQPPP
jgi:glycerol-3-phosphate dehydrogenase